MANSYDSVVSQIYGGAAAQAATSANDNPDQAARAIQLSQSTGVPIAGIKPDIDEFDKNTKASLAAGIVGGNSQLTRYVNENPEAAAVSNDDWGNLDNLSHGLSDTTSWLHKFRELEQTGLAPGTEGVHGAISGAVEGFKAGLQQVPDIPMVRPGAGYINNAKAFFGDIVGAPLAIGLGLLNAVPGALSGAASGVVKGFGGGQEAQESAGNVVSQIIESEGGRVVPEVTAGIGNAIRLNEAMEAGKPWFSAGVEPPRGVHPMIDEVKAARNRVGVNKLERDLTNAQASSTNLRSPELLKSFIDQHTGNSSIGISGDAVSNLYGDKTPTPDDGLLGWVPGIEDKLQLARETGADVHVPIGDWLTKADPQVAVSLRNDIRIQPSWITANEATDTIPPKAVVDAPIAQVRAAGGLEPMFAVGDRKLQLLKAGSLPSMFAGREPREVAESLGHNWEEMTPEQRQSFEFAAQPSDAFNIFDEHGNKAGEMEIVPDPSTKTLHVEMVNGVAGQWANSFGPSLIRSLKRQLKGEYPDYDWITGHRVSGARLAAGNIYGQHAYPRIALEAPETVESLNDFHDLLGGVWQETAPELHAEVKPQSLYNINEKNIVSGVNKVLDRMIGGRAERIPANEIYSGAINDSPLGAFSQFPDRTPQILYTLFHPDAVGIARHEGIHFLYREGFFKPEEWDTLRQAAQQEGWAQRYDIQNRYDNLHPDQQVEESIAEGYREWAKAKDEGRAGTGPVSAIFQRMQDLWEGIKQRVKAILGYEPSYQDLFQRIDLGQIAKREKTAQPITIGAWGQGRRIEPSAEGITPIEDLQPAFAVDQDRGDYIRANSIGLDIKTYKNLQESLQRRHEEDVEEAHRQAMAEQAKRQTQEWKDNRAAVKKDVEADIRQRPDVAADLFVGSGELYGEKFRQRFPLKADDLTAEQKALLPDHYYAKSGFPVEDVAHLFGFQTGDEMVRQMAEYNAAKGGMSPQEMLRDVIEKETDRQMEAKYGNLDSNILEAAKDQALGDTSLNLLTDEYYAAALQAGVPTISKAEIKDWSDRQFANMEIGNVSSKQFIAQMAKHSRDVERSLINGDPAAAIQSLQRKVLVANLAARAQKLEKEVAAFNKQAKTLSKVLPSIDGEYMNYIHQILGQIGKPIRRELHDVLKDIEARNSKNLEDFVAEKEGMLRELPVWDQLYDGGWNKDFETLSVEEFRAVRDSVKALAANGRDELKIYRAGEAEDFDKIKSQLIGNLNEFTQKHYDSKGRTWKGPMKIVERRLKTYMASLLQTETILNRWDHFDEFGPWNQYVMRDLIEGTNQKEAWQKEFSKKLRSFDDGIDLTTSVSNDLFRDPSGGRPWDLNRGNLRTVILNTGNLSNLDKMARGYHIDPQAIRDWVNKHGTKEDFDWAQKVWGMLEEIKDRSDTMYRSLTGGVASGSVEAEPFETPFGTYRGGYYPIIWHPDFRGSSKKSMGGDALEGENYVRATTPAGYTKGRTGYAAPIDLSLDQLPNRINQSLHDIALRPAVLNAAKVFYDKDIQSAIKGHYGLEYAKSLDPYLKAVANTTNFATANQKMGSQLAEFIRQNLIMTLIGLNPSTVMKHAPTAAVLSIKEVGAAKFLDAVKSLHSINEETGENNWQFAIKNSLELQRRDRNWMETLYGAVSASQPQTAVDKYMSLRQKVMQWSSKPVALSDMISAVPTWLAKYKDMIENGASHGDAVYAADRSVRNAHGSTAITSRPAYVRDSNPWLTSVYTFFNTMLQRQAETIWKAGDAVGAVKAGDHDAAMKAVPGIAGNVFAYVLWPALVEEMVSPQQGKNQTWTDRAVDGLAHSLSGSWPIVRDFVSGVLMGKQPDIGIASQGMKDVTDAIRTFTGHRDQQRAGRFLQSAATVGGLFTGLVPAQVGKSARFIYDVNTGTEHPKGPWGWLTGLRYGTLKHHSSSLNNYLEGKSW